MRRRLPPLRSLRAFEAAARHLSFARAADELAVTPAAISQQVKQLEQHLGLPLFRRGTTLTLTEPAAAALGLFTDAFDRLERAVDRLRPEAGRGPLVVSTPPSFAARWLIPRLERFQALHPDIELRLSATTRLVDFASEDVDLAIRYGTGRYPGLHVERLRAEAVVPVAAPRIAEGLKQPGDLAAVVLLHNEAMRWDPTYPDWPGWLRAVGVEVPPDLRIRSFSDATLVVQAALAGLGVALMWEMLVADDLAAGRLVALFPRQPLVNSYHLVCPPRRLDSPKVAAFRAWIMEEAAT
ncbi:MAG: transcriptional regulator GcvA [Solirubrobacterales bacterium]